MPEGLILEGFKTAVEDLTKPSEFLIDAQQSILRCYEIERKAFEKSISVITE